VSIANGLITLAEYEAFTSQPVVPQNIPGVEQAIETASLWAQRFTGRDFYDAGAVSARFFDLSDYQTVAVDDFSTTGCSSITTTPTTLRSVRRGRRSRRYR
jgi:hypothetical protein